MFDWSNAKQVYPRKNERFLLSSVHYFPGLLISFDKNSSTKNLKVCRKHYTKLAEWCRIIWH